MGAIDKEIYSEKLQHPLWVQKRTHIVTVDLDTCQHCGEVGGTKNVHHKYYIKGREPWEYPNTALITLCEKCHIEEHMWKEAYRGQFIEILDCGYCYKDLYNVGGL